MSWLDNKELGGKMSELVNENGIKFIFSASMFTYYWGGTRGRVIINC